MIRWLHLSDVHENDKGEHARKNMYRHIIKEVEQRNSEPPDVVFLTGDLAFAGTQEEYTALETDFIAPLKGVLPPDCPLFMVPGNHDADRKRAIKPRLWYADEGERQTFHLIDQKGAAKRRDALMPRFSAYAAFEQRVSAWGKDWLDSPEGAVSLIHKVRGKRMAVVGLNTAWLAQDEQDWGALTPGRDMLDHALDQAKRESPDIIIVLGHHPLEAFFNEGDWSDGQRVKERLLQANALYLHGHLHTSGSQRGGDSLRNCLAVQAPSAFDAHDNPRWRNGLMWGTVDFASRDLLLEPKTWDYNHNEYKFDTGAGYNNQLTPDGRAFRIALPGVVPPPPSSPQLPPFTPPQGWKSFAQADVQRIRETPPDGAAMVEYFDGRFPTLALAVAKGVQCRQVVDRLVGSFQGGYTDAPQPLVTLLCGPGGEGKSTALLQTAARLVEGGQQHWSCLHRVVPAAPVPKTLFNDLPAKPDHAWIVIIDDADNRAADILAAVKQLGTRNDVHFLLAARDTDWAATGIVPGLWRQVARFSEAPVDRLDEEDARRIVVGWQAWGPRGMGTLGNLSGEDAAVELLKHARELAAHPRDGALLGALLATRLGEGMKDHVWHLLHGLSDAPVIGPHSLRTIYTLIAAMHAENQLYLTPSILAFALRCDVAELERSALDRLRREAMLDPGNTALLTRHRLIAEAACAVLRQDGVDVDGCYPFLARAARQDFVTNLTGDPHIKNWHMALPQYFINGGERRWPVARAVAEAVFKAEPDNGHLVTALGNVFRQIRKPREALEILKGTGERFRSRRDVLFEWGVVAGGAGDPGLHAWLVGRSLVDGGTAPTNKDIKVSLSSLGIAFSDLAGHAGVDASAFVKARSACGQLGLRVPGVDEDEFACETFEKHFQESAIGEISIADAVLAIRTAVILGANEMEPENTPEFYDKLLGDPEGYRYTALLRAVSK